MAAGSFFFGVAACGGNATSPKQTAAATTVDAGDSGGPHPPGLSLLWNVVVSGALGVPVDAGGTGLSAVRDLPGVAGVKVCVDQHSEIPCATTGSSGSFTLYGLPSQTDLVLTCEKDGYVRSLRAIETASTDMDNTAAPIVTSKPGTPRPDLGIAYDDSEGAVSFFALQAEADGGLVLPRGVKVKLSPSSGDGPFFTMANDTFDRTATGTVGGLGFFFNLEPGDYELTFDDSSADCAPISFPFGAWGYPTPPTSVKFPVRSGFVTDQVGVLCTEKSEIVVDSGSARAE